MDRFYIACIIIGALVLIVAYLFFDRAEYRREIRHLRQGNAELLKMRGIHRVPVVPTVVHDETLMDAIETAIPEEQDYSGMFKPYVSRESRA